jgi:hypothetical protein
MIGYLLSLVALNFIQKGKMMPLRIRRLNTRVCPCLPWCLPRQGPTDHRTWMDNGGGPDNSHYTTLSRITKANVNELAVAWTFPGYGGSC